MNLANVLTVSRFFLVIGFYHFTAQRDLRGYGVAAVFFILAAVTDFLDGYVAKKYHLITNFGKIMDPIADKVLILTAFFIFAEIHLIPIWMFFVVATREIAVTVSRLVCMRHGKIIAAEREGKLKTVLQITAVSLALLYLIKTALPFSAEWFLNLNPSLWLIVQVVMMAAVALTVYSGWTYFANNFLSRSLRTSQES